MDLERQAPTHSLPVLPLLPMIVIGPVGGGGGKELSSPSANAALFVVTMDVNTPAAVMNSFLVAEFEFEFEDEAFDMLMLVLVLVLLCTTAVPWHLLTLRLKLRLGCVGAKDCAN